MNGGMGWFLMKVEETGLTGWRGFFFSHLTRINQIVYNTQYQMVDEPNILAFVKLRCILDGAAHGREPRYGYPPTEGRFAMRSR